MHTLIYFQSESPCFCIFIPHPRQAPIPHAINLRGLNVDKLRAEYQELMQQKNELTSTYKDCEKEVRELNRKLENLNQYLGRTQPDPAQEQQEKNQKNLHTYLDKLAYEK